MRTCARLKTREAGPSRRSVSTADPLNPEYGGEQGPNLDLAGFARASGSGSISSRENMVRCGGVDVPFWEQWPAGVRILASTE